MKYVIINEGTISIKRIMCNILIVYFTRKQWGNTDNLFISMALYGYTVGIIIWCGMAMGTRGRAGIFVRGGGGGSPKCPPYVQNRPPPICTKRPHVYVQKRSPYVQKSTPNGEKSSKNATTW